jgi:hypothetical protein
MLRASCAAREVMSESIRACWKRVWVVRLQTVLV